MLGIILTEARRKVNFSLPKRRHSVVKVQKFLRTPQGFSVHSRFANQTSSVPSRSRLGFAPICSTRFFQLSPR
jgi:hypothetical protein